MASVRLGSNEMERSDESGARQCRVLIVDMREDSEIA